MIFCLQSDEVTYLLLVNAANIDKGLGMVYQKINQKWTDLYNASDEIAKWQSRDQSLQAMQKAYRYEGHRNGILHFQETHLCRH